MECVVFFEQKTAYEVRISYWSSDVCASDLVAEAAATTAALEIEIAVLAPLPEFLLNRVLRARSRFGRRNLRGGPHFGRQIALAAHANLLRMAMLPSPRSPQPVTRPVWAPSTWRSPQS